MANIKKNKTAKIQTKSGGNFSYTYTDLATVNNYIESIGERYYQYTETLTNPVTGELVDYIFTVRIDKDGNESLPIRGCRIMQSRTTTNGNIAQEYNSGITYARRYSLCLAYGLATEDDDGNSAGGTRAEISTINKDRGFVKAGDIQATSKQLEMLKKLLKRELTDEEKKYTLKEASNKISELLNNENNTSSAE